MSVEWIKTVPCEALWVTEQTGFPSLKPKTATDVCPPSLKTVSIPSEHNLVYGVSIKSCCNQKTPLQRQLIGYSSNYICSIVLSGHQILWYYAIKLLVYYWIRRDGPILWPQSSPDITPLDFFLWGCVKEVFYKDKGHYWTKAEDNRCVRSHCWGYVTANMANWILICPYRGNEVN